MAVMLRDKSVPLGGEPVESLADQVAAATLRLEQWLSNGLRLLEAMPERSPRRAVMESQWLALLRAYERLAALRPRPATDESPPGALRLVG